MRVEAGGRGEQDQYVARDRGKIDKYVDGGSTVTEVKVEVRGRVEQDQYVGGGMGKEDNDMTKMSQLIAKNKDKENVGQQQQSPECALLPLGTPLG